MTIGANARVFPPMASLIRRTRADPHAQPEAPIQGSTTGTIAARNMTAVRTFQARLFEYIHPRIN